MRSGDGSTGTYRAIIRAVSDDALHTLDQFIAPDLVDHNALASQPEGLEGFKYWARSARGAFPDLTGTVEDLLTDGDKLAGRVTWRGSHRGNLMGVPATGRTVEFPAFHIVRFSEGLAVEWWGTADLLGALVQLGAQVLAPSAVELTVPDNVEDGVVD
jgi:predicted ester cyclase